jgi:hypothetical protein
VVIIVIVVRRRHRPRAAASVSSLRGISAHPGLTPLIPPESRVNPYLAFVTTIASLPAGIVVPYNVSLHVVLRVIGDARRGLQAMRQCLKLATYSQV